MCLSPQLHKYFPITIVHYGAGRRAGLGVGGVRGAHDLGRVLAMRAFWDGAFVKAGMIVHTVCGVLTYSVPPFGCTRTTTIGSIAFLPISFRRTPSSGPSAFLPPINHLG
jgi:hypothetical protein